MSKALLKPLLRSLRRSVLRQVAPWFEPATPGEVEPVSAQRWRLSISANNGHSNTSIVEIVYRGAGDAPISYSGGTASASSIFSGSFPASAAFDGSTGTRWATANGQAAPSWIEMQFAVPVAVKSVDLTSPSNIAGDMVRDFEVQYHDGADWQALASFTGETGWGSLETRNYEVQDVPA